MLYFRNDISPFLVHLTRCFNQKSPRENLEAILSEDKLRYGPKAISDAKYGYDYSKLTDNIEKQFFQAISFTETPINEVHNLLEIAGRGIDLQPYGLVFHKYRLKEKGVSPVLYINNSEGDKDALIQELCSLIVKQPGAAAQLLPFIAIYGKKLNPVGGHSSGESDEKDFTWEREWRVTSGTGVFEFEHDDVFIGLCPHEEISYFESDYPWLEFIDPQRNMKWYAEKLVRARKKADLEYSVV